MEPNFFQRNTNKRKMVQKFDILTMDEKDSIILLFTSKGVPNIILHFSFE